MCRLGEGISGLQAGEEVNSEQSYATLQGRQASRRVWAAIADWREAVDPASPSPLEWPLPPGEAGDQEIKGWRDQSAGREVVLG